MGRIEKGYEARFRSLLQQAGARRIEQGIGWVFGKARSVGRREGIPLNTALAKVCASVSEKARRHQGQPWASGGRFYCDAGLGGLARWLRAAGYEAEWKPDIDDADLLREARRLPATILTTDSGMMERRLLRDRIIPAFWLPPTLSIAEQLALVFREFKLEPRQPRCMSCGGELRRQDKEALRDRIPPRTYLWLNEYWVCSRCSKLFWHGTHWERIARALERLKP